MPRVRDLLERFRPAGAPGAASSAGVPADRQLGASAELEPIFAELTPVTRECELIRQRGAALARRRHDEAAEQARIVLARAQDESEADRATAAAAVRQRVEVTLGQDVAAADAAATAVRDRAAARQPDLVARILERVRAEFGSGP